MNYYQLKKDYVLNYFFLNYSILGSVMMKYMQEFFVINTSQNDSATLWLFGFKKQEQKN
jgi:hypothetical protein